MKSGLTLSHQCSEFVGAIAQMLLAAWNVHSCLSLYYDHALVANGLFFLSLLDSFDFSTNGRL